MVCVCVVVHVCVVRVRAHACVYYTATAGYIARKEWAKDKYGMRQS